MVVEESAIEPWDCQHPRSAFPGSPPGVDSDFISIDATGMFLILACSWRRAQRRRAFRAGIGQVVVEESAMESWDRQDPLSAIQGPPSE